MTHQGQTEGCVGERKEKGMGVCVHQEGRERRGESGGKKKLKEIKQREAQRDVRVTSSVSLLIWKLNVGKRRDE